MIFEFIVIGQSIEGGILELLKIFGLPTTLVIWFVYQSHKDKLVLEKRLNDLEEFVRSEFVKITKESTAVIASNHIIINKINETLDDLTRNK